MALILLLGSGVGATFQSEGGGTRDLLVAVARATCHKGFHLFTFSLMRSSHLSCGLIVYWALLSSGGW